VLDAMMMRQVSMPACNDAWLLLLLCSSAWPRRFPAAKPRGRQAAAADAR
jgi:hypothetical protein